jgi:UDP-2-acetamido-2-deoxy-ribo-hexuluronate aminotransferase
MNIDFANLQLQYQKYKEDIDQSIHSVLDKSNFIMGDEIYELENALAEFSGAKHAISCSSGTDALLLAMMALDISPGDEVITTPFTFVSTAETIVLMNAKPVFADIELDTYNIDASKIEQLITNKTRAIIPVSLYGQPAEMDVIQTIADRNNLKVIIDGAQSFGSKFNGQTDSTLGDISTTSFFPAKPLGCYGDGGAVFTDNDEYAEKIKMLRIHGQNQRYKHKYIGIGGRLDTIQAAILLAKLPHYKEELLNRNYVAQSYSDELGDILKTPVIKKNRTSIWAQYTFKTNNRSDIQSKLKKSGIPTSVHYPLPLHLQSCFDFLKYKHGDFPIAEMTSKQVLSLPMNPFLTMDQIQYITSKVRQIVIE